MSLCIFGKRSLQAKQKTQLGQVFAALHNLCLHLNHLFSFLFLKPGLNMRTLSEFPCPLLVF